MTSPREHYLTRRAALYTYWKEALEKGDLQEARDAKREIKYLDEPWEDPGQPK